MKSEFYTEKELKKIRSALNPKPGTILIPDPWFDELQRLADAYTFRGKNIPWPGQTGLRKKFESIAKEMIKIDLTREDSIFRTPYVYSFLIRKTETHEALIDLKRNAAIIRESAEKCAEQLRMKGPGRPSESVSDIHRRSFIKGLVLLYEKYHTKVKTRIYDKIDPNDFVYECIIPLWKREDYKYLVPKKLQSYVEQKKSWILHQHSGQIKDLLRKEVNPLLK
ncbi:MAG: hypothetical protein JXQ25_06065 [Deltaproteobacteria bacterium]|nr:hypothetical protein [Deltaproteobacteria bacterium]